MRKPNLLLLIILILITIIICIFSLLINMQEKNNEDSSTITSIDTSLKEVTDRNNFYMVKNSINTFYEYYALLSGTKTEEYIEKTYNLLDEKYINFKGITRDNISEQLPQIANSIININNMYVSTQSENISVYIVNGTLREEITNNISDFQIMVQIDSQNETFSILLQDYIKVKHSDLIVGSNLKIEQLNNIGKRKYNLYVLEEITDETYALDLVNKYKEEILYDTQLAYEHLDVQYRSHKFGTLENFQKYLADNKKKNSNIELAKYSITKTDDYTQYICVDQNEYYYIFRETAVMVYTTILDTYTVDLPEFIEKYNTANAVGKVGYNIQKCLEAINYKDYSYIYNKLYEEFKNNNYKTLESFEKAIKSKLFDINEIKEVSSRNEGETYIFKLTIADVKDNSKEQNMTVIMQLEEGTNFVMSFSFQ